MAQKKVLNNLEIKEKVIDFYERIKNKYPIKKVFVYGSYAKGNAQIDSDIDVGVVIDLKDHLKRVEITSDLFDDSYVIDSSIEPRCIFWDEYQNTQKGSILSEIIMTSKEII